MKTKFSGGSLRANRLAELCGGMLWCDRGGETELRAVCTDSREADEDTVFCAMRGERVDGHDYIAAALAKGCRCVLCERSCEAIEAAGAAAIVVRDSEMALAMLASGIRSQLRCQTVGVTGSVGKTTAKELIASVLSQGLQTYKTEGNRNSLVGMPLSVIEIPQSADWAVLEMGMNHFGEIERLSAVAEPQIAVITNIGTAHMEMLGSRENICRAKLEILCGLRDGGLLLLNGDEPLLSTVGGKSYRTKYVSLERENADFFAKNIQVEDGITRFDAFWQGGEARDLCLRVMGRHNVYNALFAIAVGVTAGLNTEEIRRGLYAYEPDGLRQNLIQVGEWTLLEDCYNASPESMSAALEVLHDYAERNHRRSVAVLGDMLELGVNSPSLHRSIGKRAVELGISQLVTVGERARQIAVGARQRGMSKDRIFSHENAEEVEQLVRDLQERLRAGDVILFKASRGIGAERIVEALKRLTESNYKPKI
ncbi:MAG: UDP-N-acetylmuramoyl-tripeptide--D-alanyl-D-alanine ligase [Ruminococcaceae bacterium]|nr:UDP-N-acetylmuramoyl-tripeptide--D-alanyl-D-alanine ligase [Oscillospiraceae bacterium]